MSIHHGIHLADLPRRKVRAVRSALAKVQNERGERTVKVGSDHPDRTHDYEKRRDAYELEVVFVHGWAIEGRSERRGKTLYLSTACTARECAHAVLEGGRRLSLRGTDRGRDERRRIAEGYARRAMPELGFEQS